MSLWDSFTGKTAKNALASANKKATAALDQGYGSANTYYDQAYGSFNPYAQGGQQGQTAYMDSLGLNGQAGAQSAYDAYASNPAYQAQNANEVNALLKRYNASPQGGTGGAAVMGLSRAAVEQYGRHQDRLAGLGQQGLAATGAQAGIRQGQGDMAMGFGATKANQATGYGNALAQNSYTGINNLMNVAGLAIKGYGAMYPKG